MNLKTDGEVLMDIMPGTITAEIVTINMGHNTSRINVLILNPSNFRIKSNLIPFKIPYITMYMIYVVIAGKPNL